MTIAAPFFSVIVPTHLRPTLLRRSLQSLRAQSFQGFEIIVIDDAGSLDSALAAAGFLRPEDSFIKRGGRSGPATSRNVGLDMARGEWVVFLDDDDCFAPHHLAAVHACIQTSRSPVLFTDCEVVTEDRSQPDVPQLSRQLVALGHMDVNSLWVKNFIPPHALAYRRSLLEGCRVDPYMASLEDWEFLLSVCERAMPQYYAGGGVIQHVDNVNHGNRRSTQEVAMNNVVILDYLYAYRRRPAPTQELKVKRWELLKSVGIDLPVEWF
ncbi:MAG TPA: glycosyltransferase [Solimonas sp.]|nr:glycosyltransferase [Solimonas sp.]